MDNKITLAASSFYNQSYYFNNDFIDLPKPVRDEIRILLTISAEQVRGIICLGFRDNGVVFLEASGLSTDHDYDEIGARFTVDELLEEKADLFKSLSLWYAVYKTPDGQAAKEEFLKGEN